MESICIRVHVHIQQGGFSLKDKMVLLQIVTFTEIYEYSTLPPVGEMGVSLKGSPGMEGGREAKGIGGEGSCELVRYKQVNDFLFPLRLLPHLSAWPGPWRDELELQPFAKQPW